MDKPRNADELTSVLFVPGNRPEMFPKAGYTDAAAVCLDLEDAVPKDADDKAAARSAVGGALGTFRRQMVLVRVNPYESGWLERDLEAVVRSGLDGIVLPKVEQAEQIVRVDNYLTYIERTTRLIPDAIWIVPIIESARGLLDTDRLLAASHRVRAALFGPEDFTNDLQINRERNSYQLSAARLRFVVACRAVGVVPLDGPEPDFHDREWFITDSSRSRRIGFAGRFCIHPLQIPIANAYYRPTATEIEEARRILATFDEAKVQGRGTTSLDGKMIDEPVAERARRLLRRAGAAASAPADGDKTSRDST
ncbi:MAG TPA: CoA ester lyase [Thermomicrobiaceae bacterium]|nr:CoA ester lyase [Thermomicrobiaceae bacterium]